jgi:hypothetical protein
MRCVPSLCARSVASCADVSMLLYQAFHTVEMVATYWINRFPSSGKYYLYWEIRGFNGVGYKKIAIWCCVTPCGLVSNYAVSHAIKE